MKMALRVRQVTLDKHEKFTASVKDLLAGEGA